MAVALQIEWDGFTTKQYDDLKRKLDWDNDPPDGTVVHAAWFEDGGLRVFDVWETREHFQRFMDQHLMPALRADMPPGRPKLNFRPPARQDQRRSGQDEAVADPLPPVRGRT